MVVIQSVPSTSRKNRRTLSKKKAPRIVGDDALHQEHETTNVTPKAKERSQDEDILIDVDGVDIAPPTEAPSFGPAPASAAGKALRSETRRVAIPPHRMSPLKRDWINIFGPLSEILGLQVRMNVQRKCVEIRVRLLLSHHRDSNCIGIHRPQNTLKNSVHYKRGPILSRHMLLVLM
jgi:RNA-binding protein PNO1